MKILLSVTMFFLSLLAHGADTMTIKVNPQQKGFQVTLPANPTTGFQWTVKQFDKELLILKDKKYIAPETKRIGAGGKMVFTFERLQDKKVPTHTEIVFQYARSWEKEEAIIKRVKIQFQENNSTNAQ